MFDIGYSELLLIAVVAIVVIGPKDLPRAMRTVGNWVGRGRAMARHMRAGFDEMMRQSELEEMEKQWREHNARIMAEVPTAADLEVKPATIAATPVTAGENATPAETEKGAPRDGTIAP